MRFSSITARSYNVFPDKLLWLSNRQKTCNGIVALMYEYDNIVETIL